MAQEVVIKISTDVSGAEKNIQEVGVGLKGIQDGAKAAGKSLFSFNNILKGVGAAKAFDAVLNILKETFKSNQKVVDTFATATTGLKLAFNDLFKFLTSGIENIKSFGAAIIDSVKQPIIDSIEALGYLGRAAIKVLALDFAGAVADVTLAQIEFNKAQEGGKEIIDDLSESVSDYVSELIEESKNIVELDKKYKIAQATNQGLIEQYDREAELQRQLRDDTRESVESRIAANEELARILNEQEEKMMENAQIAIDAAKAKLALDENNVDAQVELINAQNELAAVEARVAGFRSEQLTNQAALEKELIELKTSEQQGIIETQNIIAQGEAELIDNEVQRLEKLKEVALQEQALTKQTLEAKKASYKEGTQEFIDATNELNKFNAESATNQKKLDKEIADAKVSAITGALGSLASLVGENSKFGKAIAIAQSIIDTYAGATKALGQGGIFGFVGAASVIAAGFANIRKITSTKDPAPPSFAKPVPGGATPAVALSTPPSFNVVGATQESQLAQTIATAQQKPIRAYVVSTDISSQQALDRKTATQAAIGN